MTVAPALDCTGKRLFALPPTRGRGSSTHWIKLIVTKTSERPRNRVAQSLRFGHALGQRLFHRRGCANHYWRCSSHSLRKARHAERRPHAMGHRAHLLNNSTGLFNYRSSSELVLKPVLEP